MLDRQYQRFAYRVRRAIPQLFYNKGSILVLVISVHGICTSMSIPFCDHGYLTAFNTLYLSTTFGLRGFTTLLAMHITAITMGNDVYTSI